MKLQTIALALIATLAVSHLLSAVPSASAHEHDHDHDHDHDHGHHHNHAHEDKTQNQTKNRTVKAKSYAETIGRMIFKFNEDSVFWLFDFFDHFSSNRALQTVLGVLLVSLPSVPVFLGLKTITSISNSLLKHMMCFAAGSILGDFFLHILPVINSRSAGTISHHHHEESEGGEEIVHAEDIPEGYFWIIVGIFIFYAFDRLMQILRRKTPQNESITAEDEDSKTTKSVVKKTKTANKSKGNKTKKGKKDEKKDADSESETEEVHQHGHKHTHSHKVRSDEQDELSIVIIHLVGDFLHNVLDGVAIGVSFMGGTQLGVTTTIATLLHELPHEIGDFAFLVKKNYSLTDVFKAQVLTASGALIGGVLGVQLTQIAQGPMLGFVGGAFLYLTLSHILPEVLVDTTKEPGNILEIFIELIFLSMGIYLMYIMCFTHCIH